MPIHEYKCNACGRVMEELFAGTDSPDTLECECGGEATQIMSVCRAKFWRLDTNWFGTPEYAEARRRQCGVDN